MRGQLRYLAEAAQHGKTSIQVVPYRAARTPGPPVRSSHWTSRRPPIPPRYTSRRSPGISSASKSLALVPGRAARLRRWLRIVAAMISRVSSGLAASCTASGMSLRTARRRADPPDTDRLSSPSTGNNVAETAGGANPRRMNLLFPAGSAPAWSGITRLTPTLGNSDSSSSRWSWARMTAGLSTAR